MCIQIFELLYIKIIIFKINAASSMKQPTEQRERKLTCHHSGDHFEVALTVVQLDTYAVHKSGRLFVVTVIKDSAELPQVR